MKTIEITTAHNIILKYPLANWLKRTLAFALDLGIIIFFSVLIYVSLLSFHTLAVLIIILFSSMYHIVWEILNRGQSPGKKVLKMRVVSLHGMNPTPSEYVLRSLFRMVDILLSSGLMAILFINSTRNSQRLGDFLANTTVVNLEGDNQVSLDRIQKLHDRSEEIRFPGLVRYTDQDMIIIKQILQRDRNEHNPEIKRMMKQLSQKISHDLQVPIHTKSSRKFLKEILKEYILLTQ